MKEEAEAFMPVVNMPVVSASCVVKQVEARWRREV